VDGYDAVLIDCPPSQAQAQINALAAASRLIVLTEPSVPARKRLEEFDFSLQRSVKKQVVERLDFLHPRENVVMLAPRRHPARRTSRWRSDQSPGPMLRNLVERAQPVLIPNGHCSDSSGAYTL
jgi:cellulose biosynthesis protein BcsQ